MRRTAALVLALGMGFAYFVVLAPSPTPQTPGDPTAVAEAGEAGLAAVNAYWEALNRGDAARAVSLLDVAPDLWMAELGHAEFTAALERTFISSCVVDPIHENVVACAVSAPPAGQPDGGSAQHFELFVISDGHVVSVERSAVTAVSDAVLARLGERTDAEGFASACRGGAEPWRSINGITYNGACGEFLAGVSGQGGWFQPDRVGLWLATGS